MRVARRTSAVSAVLAVGLLAAGCEGVANGNKAGGVAEPVVLVMANGYASLEYTPALAFFARRVGELSGGDLRISVEHEWGGLETDYEAQIVSAVAAGRADLGWVGTRILGSLGVPGFRALTAPLLIDSYPLQQAVLATDIPRRMLAGLDRLEVTGLAVLPDGLRKPIAVDRPLLGPADWRGITFQSFPSTEQADTIRALGATPADTLFDALNEALDGGSVQGFEKNLLIVEINAMQARAPYVTANVNLWPQTIAVVANPDRVDRLTGQQQDWLTTAAAEAVDAVSLSSETDGQLLANLCRAGARAAEASPADLVALREAVEPVYESLAEDRMTEGFLEEIQQLKAATPPGPGLRIPAGCTGPAATATGTPAPTSSAAFPEGMYRAHVSVDFLLDNGVSRADAVNEEGLQTLTLRDGSWWHETRGSAGQLVRGCESPYSVSGDRISLVLGIGCVGEPAGGEVMNARWELAGDELRFLDVRSTFQLFSEVFWGGLPWQKIG